ncbi:unnamed protein product [Triticum turgidum subsp. durum]|uniref:Kinesin-like protein n=1 Tax=Triticum turgidum subsp. durum TaxID=4567 RepID=A0A9R0U1S4_TRITD|nr:unnamed protein product [Triticum turgidum subsp. durum]
MPTIRAPASRQTATLQVAVKCRPLTDNESRRSRHIIQVIDDKNVAVLDPDISKGYLDLIQNRTKEKRYSFDHVYAPGCSNTDVYKNISPTVLGVVQGLNVTVFAYGSTGRCGHRINALYFPEFPLFQNFLICTMLDCIYFTLSQLPSQFNDCSNGFAISKSPSSGKTYTMVGSRSDPGLMVLSFRTIFDQIKKDDSSDTFEVSCSYLEVYNEVIYDLLEKSSGHLELREDPEHGIIVAGLRRIKKIRLLSFSSSHAVLEITVRRKQKGKYGSQVLRGKLALVDLAGSERASETNNFGQKLRDGANINKSLLALANCINALGKQNKKGLAYVPYRNSVTVAIYSKLTRILKDGLSGNSRTVMIATISPADDQYHHTTNTLKYADRAKEIKTHVHKNIGTIDNHVEDYQRMIENLQGEVSQLKKELADKEHQLSVKPTEKAADNELSWLNVLSQETGENVQERINLQKALFELEETNKRNRMELQHLDGAIARPQVNEKDYALLQALTSRRQVILDNIRDNDEAGAGYRKDIELNESRRRQLQDMIEEATSNNGNRTYLQILSQYRLLGMNNAELQIEMAMRDQVIHNQRESLRSLWNILYGTGLNQKQILKLAAKQGLTVEGCPLPSSSPDVATPHGRLPPFMSFPSPQSQSSSPSSCFLQQGFSTMSVLKNQHETPTICRQEHLSSYYMMSGSSPYAGDGKQWASGASTPYHSTPETKSERSPCSGELRTPYSGIEGFSRQRKVIVCLSFSTSKLHSIILELGH